MIPRLQRSLLVSLIVLCALPALASAATYEVTTGNDSNSGTCVPGACTLRQAVNAVNGGSGGDLIKLPAGTYGLAFGELTLSKAVTIAGAGSATTTVDGKGTSRVFNLTAGASAVRIADLTVAGGTVTGTSASQARGGGIFNATALTLDNVVVRANVVAPANNTGTSPEGGGIFNNAGTLKILSSTIEANTATSLPHPGGIPSGAGLATSGGVVEITDSNVVGNTVSGDAIPQGGGIWSFAAAAHGAKVTLTRVRVDGNSALNPSTGGFANGAGVAAFRTDLTIRESSVNQNQAKGGAIAGGAGVYLLREGDFVLDRSLVAGNLAETKTVANAAGLEINGETTELQSIVNSTITGNRAVAPSASAGGVLHFGGARLDVVNSTISANSAGAGKGGNLSDAGSEGSLLFLRDSIVSGGVGEAGSENCSGAGVRSAGNNIDSLDQCNFDAGGDKVNTDPLLAPLAQNGGPTSTMALPAGSPAIDAGSGCPAIDQRGVARPQGAACDIGAFELEVKPPPVVVAMPQPARAKLKFLARKVAVDPKTGKGTLRVRCLNVAGDRCKVSMRIKGKSGWIKGSVGGQKTAKLRVKLKPAALRLLTETDRDQISRRAAGTSSNRAGEKVQIGKRLKFKLKLPKRR